jgi:hypothetical protein
MGAIVAHIMPLKGVGMRKAACRILTALFLFLILGCCSDRPGDRMIYEPWHYYGPEETACAIRRAMCSCCPPAKPHELDEHVVATRQPDRMDVAGSRPRWPQTKAAPTRVQVAKSASRPARVKPSPIADVRTCADDEAAAPVPPTDSKLKSNSSQKKRSDLPARLPDMANDRTNEIQTDSWHKPAKIAPEPN